MIVLKQLESLTDTHLLESVADLEIYSLHILIEKPADGTIY